MAGRGIAREQKAEHDPGEPDERGRCGIQSRQLAELSELRFTSELKYDADAFLSRRGGRRAILARAAGQKARDDARQERTGDDAGGGHGVHCRAAKPPTRRLIATTT